MRRTDKLWGGFSLIQDDRFFKLGQDTMLLSDFACPPARGSIMDLVPLLSCRAVLLLTPFAENPLFCAKYGGLHTT